MKLEKVIANDWRSIQKRTDALFQVQMIEIGKLIDKAKIDLIETIAAAISFNSVSDISYRTLMMHGTLKRLQNIIDHRCENLAIDIENYWYDNRSTYDLMSRVAVSFIGKKASPPWVKAKLNLKDELSKDGGLDPRMGHIRMYMSKMAAAIFAQIQQGLLKEETLNQLLTRVRRMFDRNQLRGVREATFNFNVDDSYDDETMEYSMVGPIDISEGVYTMEDVQRLQDQQIRAMQWESRQYRPWFTDEIKRNNRYLRDLEQLLSYDAINQVQTGALQIGSEEMGIKDFSWVVSRPQPKCDECTKRDGKTMSDIKKTIKDKFGDQPPPLHPNCRCQIVPKIKDDWKESFLSKDELSWDDTSGSVYKASKLEKQLGITDMSFDDYMNMVSKL